MLGLPFPELKVLYKRKKRETLELMSRKIEAFMGEKVSVIGLRDGYLYVEITSDINLQFCFNNGHIKCTVYRSGVTLYLCKLTDSWITEATTTSAAVYMTDQLQKILRILICPCLIFKTHGERTIVGKPRILALQRYISDLFDCYVRFPTFRNVILMLCAHKYHKDSLLAKIPRDVWVNLILKRYVLL